MKIGILTLPLHINYGGILQAYALQAVLERMGHTVEVLMPVQQKQPIPWIIFAKRFIRRCMGRPCGVPMFYELYCSKLRNDIDPFINDKINISRISALNALDPREYDAIVVGSDQIWRKKYFCNMWQTGIPDAFLAFTQGWQMKRLAYAASFGVDEWQFDEEETRYIRQNLANFDAVSVRELSGVKLLLEHAGCESVHLLDPTMLLSAEDFLSLAGANAYKSGGLVSYILDHSEEVDKFVDGIAAAKGLVRTELNRRNFKDSYIPVEMWITCIASADLVVTNSFHGCVFSIIFRKPLIFIGNTSRGNARFTSLIETFGLESNMLKKLSEFNPNSVYELPSDIDKRMIRMQAHSIDFLIKSLNK